MKVIFSDETSLMVPTPKSIFLAGPTPRSKDVLSWRPQALELLKDFDGIICVPERKDWSTLPSYEVQVEWEYACLSNVASIMFWVPRNMENMIGLTTNCEFGYWVRQDGTIIIYGRPDDAPHTRYLDWLYRKCRNKSPQNTLEKTIEEALNEL